MRNVLLAVAATSLTLGTAAADASAAKPIKAKYVCNKGQSLKVVFQGSKATVTPTGGRTVTLRQGLSGDGFLYAKGKTTLRGRGDDATWTSSHGKPLSCTARG